MTLAFVFLSLTEPVFLSCCRPLVAIDVHPLCVALACSSSLFFLHVTCICAHMFVQTPFAYHSYPFFTYLSSPSLPPTLFSSFPPQYPLSLPPSLHQTCTLALPPCCSCQVPPSPTLVLPPMKAKVSPALLL